MIPKQELDYGERCPRCKLKEQIERMKDPEYTANDYTNIHIYVPDNHACDHNRLCRACGLTYKHEKEQKRKSRKVK